MSLSGKITLVTGASRGIGKAIALELAKQGATVIGTATTAEGAASISDYLQAAGYNGQGMELNVTVPATIDATMSGIQSQYGDVQILVNNAGITRDNLIMRMKDEEWDDVIATNLTAIFRLTKSCIRPMIKARWGRVISISSVVGSTGNPGQTNYAAAKAGLIGFNRALALEIATRGITANIVSPGYIATEMTQTLSDDQRAKIMEMVPSQKLGQPEDIANAVAFLASDGAAYITGETLHVNGGMYMA